MIDGGGSFSHVAATTNSGPPPGVGVAPGCRSFSIINELFPKKVDSQIADAILELFRKRESIDIFNKKALYIYIREIIDAKTPKITKIANILYDIFKKKYLFYLEHGYFPS